MDWFERLTGFREESYEATRAKLRVESGRLHSLVNGKSYGVGEFELASLQTLRERAAAVRGMSGRLKVSVVTGDVRQMHQAPECAGALIQVASQFNVLEMTGPSVSPEEGVTRYEHDRTQGPACAIAAGAATIYRNYFVPVAGDSRPDLNTSDRRLGRRRRGAKRSLGQVCRNALANAQRLRSVPSDRARIDFGASGETGVGRSGCAAGKTADRRADRRRGDRRAGRAEAACFSGVLFGLACSLHASTRSLLASVRVAGAGSSL